MRLSYLGLWVQPSYPKPPIGLPRCTLGVTHVQHRLTAHPPALLISACFGVLQSIRLGDTLAATLQTEDHGIACADRDADTLSLD